ncbi:MAG: ATP-dependent helicase HrpB [Planctomycetes bacterium]|nr:ATP-dependent helicase HrpB [Planctomycetota bacterium]
MGHLGESLPVRRLADTIESRLRAQPTLVLSAETGSGKTTQVPQILLERSLIEGEIVVLQPRRLAARSVARRVAREMGVELGGLVGFQTRFERASSPSTRIRFVTDGLFVRQLQSDPSLRGVGCVVLDEFHERGLHSDMAAGFVRRLQAGARPDLKLVVMSATLDRDRLGEAFGVEPLTSEGRLFPVTVRQLGDGRQGESITERAVAALALALDERLEGDVLVFMPGKAEIDRTIEAVMQFARRRGEPIVTFPLHGQLTPEEQDRALAPVPHGQRKVVVATNVAETSLTIEGIGVVIDSGLVRMHRFDPRRNFNALRLEETSRASAEQRAGRAGRTMPGTCLRLWSERSQARRAAFDAPEVRRVELAGPLLHLASMGERDIERFPWLDPPDAAMVTRSMDVLHTIGALDASGAITRLGQAILRVPAHPRIGRAMVEAAHRGCARRVATWCSMIEGRDVLVRDGVDPVRVLQAHDRPGDVILRERLLEDSHGDGRGLLDPDAARESRRVAQQLHDAVATGDQSSIDDAACARAMLAGFPDMVAWRPDAQKPTAYLAGRRKVAIDRQSALRGAGPFLALDVREGGGTEVQESTLSMTIGLDEAWVREAFPGRFVRTVSERWEPGSLAVEEVEEERFDDAVLSRTVRPPRDLGRASELIASMVLSGELVPERYDDDARQWIERVRCVREWFPDRALPAYDGNDLKLAWSDWAHGATRWNQVRDRPVLERLKDLLTHEDCRFVERMAPGAIKLSRGFSMKLSYEAGKPPRGRAKIQDFYDTAAHPNVAAGRVPVLLEILGPNFRPLQVTSDLPGFWTRLYPDIVPALKRRYPRHEWR